MKKREEQGKHLEIMDDPCSITGITNVRYPTQEEMIEIAFELGREAARQSTSNKKDTIGNLSAIAHL